MKKRLPPHNSTFNPQQIVSELDSIAEQNPNIEDSPIQNPDIASIMTSNQNPLNSDNSHCQSPSVQQIPIQSISDEPTPERTMDPEITISRQETENRRIQRYERNLDSQEKESPDMDGLSDKMKDLLFFSRSQSVGKKKSLKQKLDVKKGVMIKKHSVASSAKRLKPSRPPISHKQPKKKSSSKAKFNEYLKSQPEYRRKKPYSGKKEGMKPKSLSFTLSNPQAVNEDINGIRSPSPSASFLKRMNVSSSQYQSLKSL